MAAYTLHLPDIPHGGISSYTDEKYKVRPSHTLNHMRCPVGGMGYYSFAREKCENVDDLELSLNRVLKRI